MPLNPAINPAIVAIITIQSPWPHSGFKSVSGSIKLQTSADSPTNIPPMAERKFADFELFPIIERTWKIAAVNRIIADKISIAIATNPAS